MFITIIDCLPKQTKKKHKKPEQNNTQKAAMESLINDLCGALLISLIEAS